MALENEQAPEFELENTGGKTVSLSERLANGPVVVIINRGSWCSFCAEQLQTFSEVSYYLWFNENVSILPVVTDPIEEVTEMRDQYDLEMQLLADPDGTVAEQYSGIEQTTHGPTGIAATYIIDREGVVRYEQIADNPADRTYGNWVRYFIRSGYQDPFGG